MGVLISTGSSKSTTVRIYEFKVKFVRTYINNGTTDNFIKLADHGEYDASGMIIYPLANDTRYLVFRMFMPMNCQI